MKRFIADTEKDEILVYKISDNYIRTCDARYSSHLGETRFPEYLNNSWHAAILLDKGKCVLDAQSITSNETILSNGRWLWSGDLNHYSQYHNFIWPEAFLSSLQSENLRIPALSYKQKREVEHIIDDILSKIYFEKSVKIYQDEIAQKMTFRARTYRIIEL